MSLPRAQSRLHRREPSVSGTLPPQRGGRTDCIPLTEYSMDGAAPPPARPPPTVRVTASEDWRSAAGSLPNGGGGDRYRYVPEERYTEETNLDGINYYPEDGRRTGKTGYIKYNSIASNKY